MNAKLTIIDNNDLRGILAPASALPQSVLIDLIDCIELSHPHVARETKLLIAKADKEDSWIPLKAVKSVKKRR